MPASITLSDLSYTSPDGTRLFDRLTLGFGARRTGLVGRNGVGKSTLLALISGRLAPASGGIAVEGRIAELRQEVQLRPGETLAEAFGIAGGLALLARIEAGEAPAEALAEADWSLPARFEAALAQAGLPGLAPGAPMAGLSGGQRTRVLLAALTFDAPDMILLDEPTNNLDAEGRAAVARLIEGWRGGAVVVSHDRALLERMDAIVELTGLGAAVYTGSYSDYRARRETELAAVDRQVRSAEQRLEEVGRRLQAAAERKARKDAAGRRSRVKGGAPKTLLDFRKERAEASGGSQAQLDGRMRAGALEALEEARAKQERLRELALAIPATGLANGRRVVEAEGLTGGPGGLIRGLDLVLTGPERLAVTGPNGAGKTTLLHLLTGRLAPAAGTVRITPAHAFLDQTMALLDPGLTLRESFLALNPGADENACRAALARFGFRNEAALRRAGALSGGETLRAGLACVLGTRPPELLILDEPTNHLDLASIEAVETALAAYDGALIVVSHDAPFLQAIRPTREVRL